MQHIISVGIIDTKPLQIKEGRRISTKSELNSLEPPRLLEVSDPNAPNVLTNDPNFFENDYPPKNAGLKINQLDIFAYSLLFAVLNVFDGQLRITNMEWDENLHRKSSEIYQIISKELEDELMNLFKDVPLDNNSQVMVKVNKFAPGSVLVLYTVGWLSERDVLTSATVRNCSILCSPLVKSLNYRTLTTLLYKLDF